MKQNFVKNYCKIIPLLLKIEHRAPLEPFKFVGIYGHLPRCNSVMFIPTHCILSLEKSPSQI